MSLSIKSWFRQQTDEINDIKEAVQYCAQKNLKGDIKNFPKCYKNKRMAQQLTKSMRLFKLIAISYTIDRMFRFDQLRLKKSDNLKEK